jgi:hypothetical protein
MPAHLELGVIDGVGQDCAHCEILMFADEFHLAAHEGHCGFGQQVVQVLQARRYAYIGDVAQRSVFQLGRRGLSVGLHALRQQPSRELRQARR